MFPEDIIDRKFGVTSRSTLILTPYTCEICFPTAVAEKNVSGHESYKSSKGSVQTIPTSFFIPLRHIRRPVTRNVNFWKCVKGRKKSKFLYPTFLGGIECFLFRSIDLKKQHVTGEIEILVVITSLERGKHRISNLYKA